MEDLENSLDVVHGVPSARRKPLERELIEMTPNQLVDLVLAALAGGATKGGRPPSGGWRKWLVQSLKLGIGGSLAAFDLYLGFGLLVGTLLSAGGGEIGSRIAVAGSVHIGCITALNALNQMLKTA